MSTLADLPSRLLHDPANKPRIEAATRAPFLHRAGFEFGFVNARTLCAWLVQDLRYTQAYIRFASGLLSCIVLPGSESSPQLSTASSGGTNTAEIPGSSPKDRILKELTETLQRLIDLLLGALNNVRREQKFFDETVAKYNLSALYDEAEHKALQAGGMNDATREYATLFDRFAAGGDMYRQSASEMNGEPPHRARKRTATQTAVTRSKEDAKNTSSGETTASTFAKLETLYHGLLILWSTEWCYYTAWSYVLSLQNASRYRGWTVADVRKWFGERPWSRRGTTEENDNAKAALGEAFIPNWTSGEFKAFVKECEMVLNDVGRLLDGMGGEERIGMVRKRGEELFHEVLELEKGFWPVVEQRYR